jgi:hypothetical protein
MVVLGHVGHVESRFGPFREVLVSIQDRCMVCAKHTIGSKIVLDTPDSTPWWWSSSGCLIQFIWYSANLDAKKVRGLCWTYQSDMNPQGFVIDLSMRSVRNSIWGWRWRSWPDYSLPSCALATDTPPPTVVVILWSTINQTTRVIPASNRGTSKNK